MSMAQWMSIESYANQVISRQKSAEVGYPFPVLKYKGKIKLHGQNAGIRVENGSFQAQSRTEDLSEGNSLNGFWNFVKSLDASWAKEHENFVIFGEWFGRGIQKGAYPALNEKYYAIFSIENLNTAEIHFEPEVISAILGDFVNLSDRIFVLPWQTDEYIVDYANPSEHIDTFNSMINAIEKSDPWVKKTFGFDQVGEGLVFYPIEQSLHEDVSRYIFKAKGLKHAVNPTKAPVQVDVELINSVNEFASSFVTEARLEQAASVVGLEKKLIGPFIKWVIEDVKKESKHELEKSKLDFMLISKKITELSKNWYLSKVS
jgi:hypothetical protein